jgi:hypothetical protein
MNAFAVDQHAILAALLDPLAPIPATLASGSRSRAEAGFAVHRNNVAVGLIEVVAARYPVACRLAGEESFRAVARRFVLAQPPRSPGLLHYAETFPDFLRSLGPAPSIHYLADVAELEMLRGRAYHAADAAPVGRAALASLPPERLANLRMALHPSVGLFMSRFPVVTVWEANYHDAGNFAIRQWGAEQALVARPFLEVDVWRLPAGGLAFLTALGKGATLAAATEVATATAADFYLGAGLALLIESDIVVGFQSDDNDWAIELVPINYRAWPGIDCAPPQLR